MATLVGTIAGLVDADDGRPVAHAGHEVLAVAGEWALLDGRRVAAADGRAGPVFEGPDMTCLVETDGDLLAGTADAHLYCMGGEVADRVLAFDEAEGRHEWYTPWGGPPAVRSLAAWPGGPVLVNVHVGGIVRSTDAGASWLPTIDIDHDVHQVLALPGGRALAACASGLGISHDGGATWTVDAEGLHATYSRAVAVAGDTVLLTASTGPMGERSAVYRRPLGATGPFERCRDGLPEWFDANIDTFRLAGRADGTAAFVMATGDVWVSPDEGASWARAAKDVTGARCLVLT